MAEDVQELARVRRLVHSLVCRDRLSPELAQERLSGSYLVQRTLAEVLADLDAYSCDSCARQPAQQAGQAEPEQPAARVHQSGLSGSLTGMLDHG